jgi:hypothetical protein
MHKEELRELNCWANGVRGRVASRETREVYARVWWGNLINMTNVKT